MKQESSHKAVTIKRKKTIGLTLVATLLIIAALYTTGAFIINGLV